MDDKISAWVEEATGGRITKLERPASGGSRELYLVDITKADGEVVPLVLRIEAGGSFTGTPLSVAREAVVYRALADTPVPAPKAVALAPDGSALLLERIPGVSDLYSLEEAERRETFADFMDALAALHNVDVGRLELEGFARPQTPEDHALLDLALWEQMAENGVDDLDPIAVYAGAWLKSNAPSSVERTVLVHGDVGPGNFMAEKGKVTGILDWEFAHLGDPMDDVAWLDMRVGGRTGLGLGDMEEHYRRYSEATGIPIDSQKIDYYKLAVQYRCAITTSLAVSRGGGARGWPPYLLVTQRYLLRIAELLSRYLGVSEPAVELPDVPETPRTPWYDNAMDGIRAGVRGIPDPELREGTRNVQILMHYLRAYDRIGRPLDEVDRSDRATSLGIEPNDEAAFRKAVGEGGSTGDETTLRYLLRRSQRQAALWESVLSRQRRR